MHWVPERNTDLAPLALAMGKPPFQVTDNLDGVWPACADSRALTILRAVYVFQRSGFQWPGY